MTEALRIDRVVVVHVMSVRIVSLNAWGGAMLDPLVEWLPRCDADVICLQEVTRTPALGGWTHFDDGERTLPQRANLFDDLRAAVPSHQATFVTSDAGPVLDQQGCSHQQDFGLATFIHERIPVLGQEASFVHGSFVEHRQWAIADRPRIAQAVRLVDRATERAVVVLHVHGLRDPEGKGDTPARRRQAERLVGILSRMQAPGDLTIVCGDLNLLPDSETFAILGARGLVDLVGSTDTRTSRYPRSVRHANYLLISDRDAVKNFEVLAEPEVSDHRPLVLDL
jgi:endonuclease/exonuclease/phosphatase family metal-dependent hydrolase